MRPRALAVLSLPLSLLLLAGCSGSDAPAGAADAGEAGGGAGSGAGASAGPAPAPQTHEAMAMNNAFEPRRLTVRVGDTVRWSAHDSANPHNVVSGTPGNEFRSPDMDAVLPTYAREFSHAFAAAGTVDYVCEYHPGMVGQVVVVE